MFSDRSDAGIRLALKLRKFRNQAAVILAVPRGGVPVAYEVAKELNLPLEVMLVKKLGHPRNNEYAIGAVGLQESFVFSIEDVSPFYIQQETEKVRSRLKEMQQKFMAGREPENLEGKTVIVVDDGIATGNTLLATVRILKRSRPAKIVVAAPVVSMSAADKLGAEVDELIALLIPARFKSVGAFYEDFTQVSDEEAIGYLNKLSKWKKTG